MTTYSENERATGSFRLVVRGLVAASVTELIRSRFDHVTTRTNPGQDTVLVVTGIDPASERALLVLLWDSGHNIVSMRSTR